MSENIGQVIRTLRREQEVTQDELANALHISNQSVSKWENGQANPDIAFIPAIADYFKVSVDTLFAYDKPAPYSAYQRNLEQQKRHGADFDAVIALWEELYQAYPNDYRVRKELVCALCAKGGVEPFDRIFDLSIDLFRNNRNPSVERELLLALKAYFLEGKDVSSNRKGRGRPHAEIAEEMGLGERLTQAELDRLCREADGPGKGRHPKGKRVLIVDDASFMRNVLREILRREGYEIAGEAANGYEAIEAADSLLPDIITLDITMPDMDGLAALKRILPDHPDTCVIMCSAMLYPDLAREALENGASALVAKPFRQEQLAAALKGL